MKREKGGIHAALSSPFSNPDPTPPPIGDQGGCYLKSPLSSFKVSALLSFIHLQGTMIP